MDCLKKVAVNFESFSAQIEQTKKTIRFFRQKRDLIGIRVGKKELVAIRKKKREYFHSLNKEERHAYRYCEKRQFDVIKCSFQRKLDSWERKIFRKVNPAYIYILPAALGAILFTVLPGIFMLFGSFFKVNLVSMERTTFVGLWNYQMVFTRDTEFQKAFWNTIIYSLFTVGVLMVVTLLMATWLRKNSRIHNLSQTMIFTPHVSSMVSVAILWTLMLDPQGIINQALALFGIDGPNWLMNSRTSLISVGIVAVWKSIGYYVLLIIAGLQSIPSYVYEAAKLDKASSFTIFRRITIPLLSPTLMFVFMIKLINSFKSFVSIDLMTQGGPQGSSMVLGYWIYTAGRVKFNYGFSMVGAVVLTLMVSTFTILAYKLFNKKVVY